MSRRLALAVALLAAPALAGDAAIDPLLAHDGRTSLAELRGQPVVFSGFRRHVQNGLHAAYFADFLLRKHGDDGLVVVLRDQQPWETDQHIGLTRSFWVRFFFSQPWLSSVDGDATHPFRDGAKWTDRTLVLIGVDGRVVLDGEIDDYADKPAKDSFQRKFHDAVKAELDRRDDGWGAHAGVRKARALLHGKDQAAKAWQALARVPDGEAADEVAAVRAEIRAHVAARARAVVRLLSLGRYADADAQHNALGKATRGVDELTAPVAALAPQLASDEAKAGRKAEKKLQRLLRPLEKRKFKDLEAKDIWKVRALAKDHPESPIGARAQRLDPYLKAVWAAMRGIGYMKADARLEAERRG